MAAEPDGRWIEVSDMVDAHGNEKTRFMWAVESEFNRRWRLEEETEAPKRRGVNQIPENALQGKSAS